MSHVIEPATTGRAKCRFCGDKIAAGEQRFGERVPNAFADEGGETTLWFHVWCGACARPEPFLEALAAAGELADRPVLVEEARLGAAHHRVPRVRRVERASSGRASCRSCREPIAKGSWRIVLVFNEEGRFVPSGFIHLSCARTYLETTTLMRRLRRLSPDLGDADAAEIEQTLTSLD